MKKKFKISLCLLVNVLFMAQITHANTTIMPIQHKESEKAQTSQESSWSKMSARITAFFYGKNVAPKKATPKKSKKLAVKHSTPPATKPVKNFSRSQAIEEIRKVTSRLFDPKDTNHITLHLNQMKEFTIFLDEVEDKKIIAAIHFLLENHHRSSPIDIAFWIQASQRLELDTVIPMTPEIAKKTKAEKLKLLSKKMTKIPDTAV